MLASKEDKQGRGYQGSYRGNQEVGFGGTAVSAIMKRKERPAVPLKPDTKQKVKELLARLPEKDRAKAVQLAAVNRELKRRKAQKQN